MSRSPALVVVSLVLGLVVGFAAGFLIPREKEKGGRPAERQGAALSADERAALVSRADAAVKERDEAMKALEDAKASVDELAARVAAIEKGGAQSRANGDGTAEAGEAKGLTDQEKQAKLAELEQVLEKAEKANDGAAIMKALQELVALGEAAYPRCVEVLGLIFADMMGDKKLKLATTEVYMSLSGKKWDLYNMWALNTPTVDAEAREGAVAGLIWSRDPKVSEFLESKLATEKDRGVAKAIMDSLAWKDPNAKDAIRKVLETRRDDKQIRLDAVNSLWTMGDETAMAALTSAAQGDPDPDVREAARIASRGIDPPVAGYMVNYVDTAVGGQAALQRGDIVLAYNGKPISSSDTLGKESRGTDGMAEVPIQIFRNGEVVNTTVKGGSIDVWGRYVKPK